MFHCQSVWWWFQPTPLKNMEIHLGLLFPIYGKIWKVMKFMFQTTIPSNGLPIQNSAEIPQRISSHDPGIGKFSLSKSRMPGDDTTHRAWSFLKSLGIGTRRISWEILTQSYGKSPFSTSIFHSKLLVYWRVTVFEALVDSKRTPNLWAQHEVTI